MPQFKKTSWYWKTANSAYALPIGGSDVYEFFSSGPSVSNTGAITGSITSTDNTPASGGNLVVRANSSDLTLQSHAAARTISRYGITLGGWTEIKVTDNTGTNNGLVIGTQSNTPIALGTNNVERLRINGDGTITGGLYHNPQFTGTVFGTAVWDVGHGGTGMAAGTSGGIPYFNLTSSMATSGLLAQYGVIYGGGVGGAPASTAAGTTSQVLIGGSGPSFASSLPNGVQDNITRTGIVTSGTWQGGIVAAQFGGTGVNNGTNTLTLGGGTFAFTAAGNTSLVLPTAGTVTTNENTMPPLTYHGGVSGGSTSVNNAAIVAVEALSAEEIHVPFGTFATTKDKASSTDFRKRYSGPGTITASGNALGRYYVNSSSAVDTSLSVIDPGSSSLWFNGDWSRSVLPIEYVLSAPLIASPTLGAYYQPFHASPIAIQLFAKNGSLHRDASDGTANVVPITLNVINDTNGGGTGGLWVNVNVGRTYSGFDTATPTRTTVGGAVGGNIYASADNVFLGFEEGQLSDNGYRVAGIHTSIDLNRTIAAGGGNPNAYWTGIKLAAGSSTQDIDGGIVAQGPFKAVFDTTCATISGAALALLTGHGIYFNSTAKANGTGVNSVGTDRIYRNTARSTVTVAVGGNDIIDVKALGIEVFGSDGIIVGQSGTTLGVLDMRGNTSGSTRLRPAAAAGGTITVPTVGSSDTVVLNDLAATLSNKTFVAPVLGAATLTSANKVAITAPATSATLTIQDGTTLSYEQGTWTPTLEGGTTAGTGQTYSVQVGSYEKIGRRVIAQFKVTATSLGTASGNMRIRGLPFTAANTTNDFAGGYCSEYAVASLPASHVGMGGTVAYAANEFILRTQGPTGHSPVTEANVGASGSFIGIIMYHT